MKFYFRPGSLQCCFQTKLSLRFWSNTVRPYRKTALLYKKFSISCLLSGDLSHISFYNFLQSKSQKSLNLSGLSEKHAFQPLIARRRVFFGASIFIGYRLIFHIHKIHTTNRERPLLKKASVLPLTALWPEPFQSCSCRPYLSCVA